MLSLAQRVFDPIGFTCPISLRPKLLLQKCWEVKGDWDQDVQEDVKNDFLLWLRELPLLEEVTIPRCLKGIEESVVNCSLHIFCDASKAAYAAAVFVRAEYSTCVQVQLVQARSRVSPLKQLTIPRLELLAANDQSQVSSLCEERDGAGRTITLLLERLFYCDRLDTERGLMGHLRMEYGTGDTKFDDQRGLASCAGCHELC
jgi:hypothetical protein